MNAPTVALIALLPLVLLAAACDDPQPPPWYQNRPWAQDPPSNDVEEDPTPSGDDDDGCWTPDVSESDVSCAALCDEVTACAPGLAEADCRAECDLIQPYLSVAAGSTLTACVDSEACGDWSTFGEALDGCVGPAILDGTLEAPAANTEVCDALVDTMDGCGGGDQAETFGQVCWGFAAALGEESMQQLGQCSAVACNELEDCMAEAACFLDIVPQASAR